ncbi:MAG: hypothetical protein Q7S00_02625, partial [bacterium]|nr:hypothetical protein [bacterium]
APLKVNISLHGKVAPERKIPVFEDYEEDVEGILGMNLQWLNVREKAESGELRATNSFLADTSRGAKINRGSLDFLSLTDSELTWLFLKGIDPAPWLTINRLKGYNGNPNLIKFYFLYEPSGKIEETAMTQPPMTFKSKSYGMVQVMGQHRMGEAWNRAKKSRKPFYFPTFVITMTDELMEKLVIRPFGGIENVPLFPPPFLKKSRIGIKNPGVAIRKKFFVNAREKIMPVLEKSIQNVRANFLVGALPLGGVGVACGTLSPTHQGHLSLWEQGMQELGLKKMIVFTVPRSRTHTGKILPHPVRQAILRRAVEKDPHIEIFSPLEGWTVTDNIRRALTHEIGPFTLVCGSDTAPLYLNDPQFPKEVRLAIRKRLNVPLPERSERVLHLMDNPSMSEIANRVSSEEKAFSSHQSPDEEITQSTLIPFPKSRS